MTSTREPLTDTVQKFAARTFGRMPLGVRRSRQTTAQSKTLIARRKLDRGLGDPARAVLIVIRRSGHSESCSDLNATRWARFAASPTYRRVSTCVSRNPKRRYSRINRIGTFPKSVFGWLPQSRGSRLENVEKEEAAEVCISPVIHRT